MKEFIALTAAIVVSISVGAAADAAPATTSAKGGAKATLAQQKAKPGPGVENAKKALKGRLDADRKIAEIRKLAQARKHQAQNGN